jgi:hypothetical protein
MKGLVRHFYIKQCFALSETVCIESNALTASHTDRYSTELNTSDTTFHLLVTAYTHTTVC